MCVIISTFMLAPLPPALPALDSGNRHHAAPRARRPHPRCPHPETPAEQPPPELPPATGVDGSALQQPGRTQLEAAGAAGAYAVA